ncbi:hypothetical protein B0H13DRAFT_2117359 [Mycena leptocephala]|nr:hypothetical protein B0H13DRAFT_2117359 [Mycena leptocephala]
MPMPSPRQLSQYSDTSPEEADRSPIFDPYEQYPPVANTSSSSPEEADRSPIFDPYEQYPPVANTSSSSPEADRSPIFDPYEQYPPMPPSARARQKSRKTEVDESDSSDSEGTAKPLSGKNPPAIKLIWNCCVLSFDIGFVGLFMSSIMQFT